MQRSSALMVLLCATFSALVWAAASSIDKPASNVAVTFSQMGVAVDARFTRFSGSIDYDPANIAAAKAQLSVDVASFDIGDAEYNKEVQKKEWFDAAQYPQATFASTSIKALSADKLQIQGRLVIKGKQLDVTLPVTLKSSGKTHVFSGTLPIKRLYFNIGEGEWNDTDTLADEVIVKFSIAATPAT